MSEEYPLAPPWIAEMLKENELIKAQREFWTQQRIIELMKESEISVLEILEDVLKEHHVSAGHGEEPSDEPWTICKHDRCRDRAAIFRKALTVSASKGISTPEERVIKAAIDVYEDKTAMGVSLASSRLLEAVAALIRARNPPQSAESKTRTTLNPQ